MLLLSRKVGEKIRIADDITLVVTSIQGDRVKIGIDAPMSISVLRGELVSNGRTSSRMGVQLVRQESRMRLRPRRSPPP